MTTHQQPTPALIACCAVTAPTAAATNPQWVHLFPTGQVTGRDGRGPYIIGDMAAIIEETRRYAGKNLLPVDYEHATDLAAPKGQPAPAAGWIKGLQARQDGIWGLIEWTGRAADHLKNREYRYISPTFHHQKDGRVIRLLRAGLTNNPNLELTALASAGGTMDPLIELRQALDLPADATADAIIAAVRELVTARCAATTPDPTRFVPIGEFERVVTEYQKTNQGVALQAAEAAVTATVGLGLLPPFLRDWGVALCSVNKPAFDDFIKRTGPAVHRLFEPSGLGALPPGGAGKDAGLSDGDLAVCTALGIAPGDYVKTRGA